MTNKSMIFTNPMQQPASVDALSQVLNAMRISGSLLLKEKYIMPWAVSVPDSDSLNKVFKMDNQTRITAFHLVEQGHIYFKLENGENV